ncbi:MAG TPA: hypothetical protein VMW27_19135 [Thermoanaerobaculia bacterium]|nr:hypothetical protein [Thermoanaerobaculia bacterium]
MLSQPHECQDTFRLRVAGLLAVLLLLISSAGVRAQSESPAAQGAAVPDDASLERRGAAIGAIRIVPRDIFDKDDPKEDRKVFHLVNRLHRTTRPQVIERQLLFRSGDPYSRRVLEESERILRQDRYLYDADIRPVRYEDGHVDLEVVTQDVWTLNVGVGFGHSGGATSTHFQLQDTNLLGTGKSLTLGRETNVDRSSSLFRYDDPALLGSRVKLGAIYADNSDGSSQRLDVEHPFFSLDSRWTAGLTASSDDRVDALYELGHVTDRFRHRQDQFEVRGGLSRGLVAGRARRWTAGFTFQRDRFAPAEGFADPAELPGDRTLAYPWIGFDSVEDQYSEVRNMNQLNRTEDLYLGTHYHLRLGLSSSLWGADRDAAVLDGTAGTGFRLTSDQTLVLGSDLSGRWGRQGPENLRLDGSAQYFWRDFGEHLFFATLDAALAHDLDPENQLLLGGDSGLRGYPLRYQDGDGRLLLSLEQRFFTGLYPFHLFHVGAAVFFDAGRTWASEGSPEAAGNLGWLRDAGVGLRLSSSRSGLGSVVHIDLAFPLDGDPSIQNTQWLVTTKASF